MSSYGIRTSATVSIDLSGGKYAAEEFKDYDSLKKENKKYRYETQFEGGEYVSRAACEVEGAACYVDTMSASNASFWNFMEIFLQ